jgi:AraC-like DNA-binding protein
MEPQNYEERGYLRENYRLFHLTGPVPVQLDWHYHAFHKIVMFLTEGASYGIEGRSYSLETGDLVLVSSGCIHRPEIAPGAAYERFILYISPAFLRRRSTQTCDLEMCFRLAQQEFSFVVRPAGRELVHLLRELELTAGGEDFGAEILADSLFFQFLVAVSRGLTSRSLPYAPSRSCDEKTVAILQYISRHLTEPLSIDDLAEQFYISKYHMMRRFKEETGCTIHGYLTGKRLILAREKIAAGTPVTRACYESGFSDYSAFARAYKKQFLSSPRDAVL